MRRRTASSRPPVRATSDPEKLIVMMPKRAKPRRISMAWILSPACVGSLSVVVLAMLIIASAGVSNLQVEDGGIPSGHIHPPVDTDEVVEVIERVAVLRFPRPPAVVRSEDRAEFSDGETGGRIEEADRGESSGRAAFPLGPAAAVHRLEDQAAESHSCGRPGAAPGDAQPALLCPAPL